MVIVPRIAAVSYLDTIPFLYGIKHEANFRADLSLSDYSTVISEFNAGQADIALVPVHVVPQLHGAHIITEYCIGFSGNDEEDEYLPIVDPKSPILSLFEGEKAPLASLLDSETPWAYAVWVAHKDVDLEVVEQFEYALTYGLERMYEALLDAGCEDLEDAYDQLSHIDYVLDQQKHETLKKFWDSGLKVPLRANPG